MKKVTVIKQYQVADGAPPEDMNFALEHYAKAVNLLIEAGANILSGSSDDLPNPGDDHGALKHVFAAIAALGESFTAIEKVGTIERD